MKIEKFAIVYMLCLICIFIVLFLVWITILFSNYATGYNFCKNLCRQWDKVDDKYAVAALGAVGIIVLWSATGMISVSDSFR